MLEHSGLCLGLLCVRFCCNSYLERMHTTGMMHMFLSGKQIIRWACMLVFGLRDGPHLRIGSTRICVLCVCGGIIWPR